MPQLNQPTSGEILALVLGDPSRPPRIGAIDAAWIDYEVANRQINSVPYIETAKMRTVVTDAGLDYTALSVQNYGSIFNALCYACIYQYMRIDYRLRISQAQKVETREEFNERLNLAKEGICSSLNEAGVFSEEYCGTGYEKVTIHTLTAEDF